MNEKPLLDLFNQFDLHYELHEHEAVFTCEASDRVCTMITGPHGKNLFLRDEKKNFFLLSTFPEKRVDLKTLSKEVTASRFSFGNPEQLFEKLGVKPGSVTPYGLMNTNRETVTFLLDQDFLQHEIVNFHPLRNDMTISMDMKGFLAFFDHIQHPPKMIKVPTVS
jgi:Ala-tRNA(Pro) deacylase